jgi:uncharacterized protein (TIGR00369 family)
MSRREQLESLFNDGAPIAKTFGMRLHYDDADRAVVILPYNPGLDHALQGVHGGIYMTLLDTAAWFSSAVLHDGQCWITTAEMSVHFLKASARTQLRAVGIPIKSGKRQDIVEARVFDAEERLCGHAVGTFVVLPGVPLAP